MKHLCKYILLFIAIGYSYHSQAQGPSLNYLRTMGVPNPFVNGEWDMGTSVDHDLSGNMYVAGNTRGAKIYVQNADSLAQMTSTSSNHHTIFVYKYNNSGGIDFAFTLDSVRSPEVFTLSDGSFYLVYSMVYASGSIDANPHPSQTFWITQNVNPSPMIVSRFSAAGGFMWAFKLDLQRSSLALSNCAAAIDHSDNLVIAGNTIIDSLQINMNPMGTPYPLLNGTGILAKYNPSGQLVWARDSVDIIRSLKTGGFVTAYKGMAINSKNQIVIAKDIDTSKHIIDLDPTVGVYNLVRDSGEVIVATYDSNGAFASGFNFGKYVGGNFSYERNRVDVLQLDSSDNIYINGVNLYGDFDPDPTKTYEIAQNPVWSIQKTDNFIASYTSTGNLRWVNAVREKMYYPPNTVGDLYGGLGNYSNGNLANFRTDENGNQYVIYYVRNQIDLDLGPDSVIVHTANVNLLSSTTGQFVLAQYDLNGTYVDHTILYDTSLKHSDYIADFAMDNNCNFYATGCIGKSKSFTTVPVYSSGVYIPYPLTNGAMLESDALAIKYSFSNIPKPYLVRSKSDLEICEGESGRLFVGSKGPVEWYDSATNGNLLGAGYAFNYPVLYANKTFYAQSLLCGTNSPRVAITVNVTTIDSTITRVADTLWVTEVGAVYQWIDCNTNLAIAGATNQYLKVPGIGNYAVRITKGTCVQTSPCAMVAPESIDAFAANRNFSIFPNPTNSSIQLKTNTQKEGTYQIVNGQGASVKKGTFTGSTSIDVSDLSNGVYFINIPNLGSARFIKK